MTNKLKSPFTANELFLMQRSMTPNPLWKKAFKFYNENSGDKKLTMRCPKCYKKVMLYLQEIK